MEGYRQTGPRPLSFDSETCREWIIDIPDDESSALAKVEQAAQGVFSQFADRVMTACSWIKHLNSSSAILTAGVAEEIHKLEQGDGFLSSEMGVMLLESRDRATAIRETTFAIRALPAIKTVVNTAKVLTLYNTYRTIQRGIADIQVWQRASSLAETSRSTRAAARVAEASLKMIKGVLSSFRAAQQLLGYESLSGAYKEALLPVLSCASTFSSSLHLQGGGALLEAFHDVREAAGLKGAMAWLETQLDLTPEEEERIHDAAAQSDIESGDGGIDKLRQLALKDKEKELEQLIGKTAVTIIRDVRSACQQGREVASPLQVATYFQEAVEQHLETLKKGLLASGSAVLATVTTIIFPQLSMLSLALTTLSLTVNTHMMVDKLQPQPTYRLGPKED